MIMTENLPVAETPHMAIKRVRIPVEYGAVLLELLADLDNTADQLPLFDGEAVGHRRFTPIERLAVDELRAQVDRALRFR